MTATKTDELVRDYLHRLEITLRPLPASRRDQLVSEITEHIEQGRAGAEGESEAAVRELLDRLGEPEDIAAAALNDEPTESQTRRLAGGWLIVGVLVVLVVVGFTIAALLGAFTSGGSGSSQQQSPPSSTTALVEVPNVTGESATSAASALRVLGVTSQVESIASATVPAGVIISMTPVTGSKVEKGSVVTLTKSSGPAEQSFTPERSKVPGTP